MSLVFPIIMCNGSELISYKLAQETIKVTIRICLGFPEFAINEAIKLQQKNCERTKEVLMISEMSSENLLFNKTINLLSSFDVFLLMIDGLSLCC